MAAVPRRSTSFGASSKPPRSPPGVVRGGESKTTRWEETHMRIRNTSIFVLGAVAMLAVSAANASAQDTTKAKTTSAKRIRISKEAGGEVVPTTTIRVDT